ncbi:DUF1918 domain-containing protein [Aquipuribacter nitratireducens]|uniref:DUF1918 domain-containing protein n=1 Tax=Aquipuribacter nitratireducens TaxID=650104 RepID=A0ABW0GNA3_9MICO
MHAKAGERLVVHSNREGAPGRDAEILEARGEDGAPPYLVRWSDDGHESLVFPGPDAEVVHEDHPQGS